MLCYVMLCYVNALKTHTTTQIKTATFKYDPCMLTNGSNTIYSSRLFQFSSNNPQVHMGKALEYILMFTK